MQSVANRPPQVVPVRRIRVGGRGELEEPFAIVARGGIKKRGRRTVARARDAMAMQTVSAVKTITAGDRLVIRSHVGLDPLGGLLVIGQPSSAVGEERSKTLRHNDLAGVRTVQL